MDAFQVLIESSRSILVDRTASIEKSITDAAIAAGFLRARFWRYAHDSPVANDLVLVAHSYDPRGDVPMYDVGKVIPSMYSHIDLPHSSGGGDERVVRAAQVNYEVDDVAHTDEIASALGPISATVFEVPLVSDGILRGLLALETPSEIAARGELDVRAADVLGDLLALRLEADDLQAEAHVGDELAYQFDDDIAVALSKVATLVAAELRAAIVAIFRWDMESNRLEKAVEVVQPEVGIVNPSLESLDESYMPGRNFTGSAWSDPSQRFLYEVGGIIDERADDLDDKAYPWHVQQLGSINSVLYESLLHLTPERTGSLYLLRVINRADDRRIPMVQADTKRLRRIADRVGGYLNDAHVRARLRGLMGMTEATVLDLSTFVERFYGALALEGIRTAVVITAPVGRPPDWINATGSVRRLDPPDESDYQTLRSRFLAANGSWEQLGQTRFEEQLIVGRKIKALLGVPFDTDDIEGLLLVPSESDVASRTAPTRSLTESSRRYLESCCDLLARGIQIRRANLIATGALEAMGYLGHEMGTPMLQLGALATHSVARAREIGMTAIHDRAIMLRAAEAMNVKPTASNERLPRLFEVLEETELELEARAGFLASLLSVAPVFALREDRAIRAEFRPAPVSDLVDLATQRTFDDPLLRHDQADALVQHRWRINRTGSSTSSHECVVDRYFVSIALSNLLRNAVKYSIPQPKRSVSRVELNVQLQTNWLIFEVTNYGIGISQGEVETIFQPFVQGTNIEFKRAVKGMGLGLHLTRVLAEVHQGSVSLITSEPHDYDDPARIAKLEGFKTVFELRVSTKLDEGVREVGVT